ncbi:MAG: 2'-5' RNA ligase family protein, partial [Candidatus Paceibacteria bacterium]
MRTFVAIELPEALKRTVSKFASQLQKAGILDAKFVRPEQLHLTLKFLGEVYESDIDKIKAVL